MKNKLYKALGELVVSFSRLEACAAEVIAEFFPVKQYRKIEAITSELSFKKRLDILQALAKSYGLNKKSLHELEKAIVKAAEIEAKRNEIIHSHWEATYQTHGGKEIVAIRKVRITSRRKNGTTRRFELPVAADIEKLALEARRASAALHEATCEVAASCKERNE